MKSKSLRILFLGSQMEIAGAQKVLLSRAAASHKRGYSVQAVFFYDKQNLAEKWQAEYPFPVKSLDAWRYGAFPLLNYFRALGGMLRLWSMLRKNVDIIESYTPHSNVLGMIVARLARVPIRIPTHHGYIENSSSLLARVHGWMINNGFSTKMVAVSEQVRQYAIEKEGVNDAQIEVIENGIEDPIKKKLSAREKQLFRAKLGLQKDQLLFLTTGRLTIQKGHTVLLNAIAQEKENFAKIFFAFAGDGPQKEKLQGEAEDLGIQSMIHFLGIRSDVADLLQAADLFVQPSLWEGLSLAMLEALFAGCPVLATRVEGVIDVIDDGQTGFLVEPGDPHALAEKMSTLLPDERVRTRIAKAGQAHARRAYGVERMCDEYDQLIHALARQKGLLAQ